MNRRHLVLATLLAASTPLIASAQTPLASPATDEADVIDTRARDLTALLQTVSPVELVAALQTTPVDEEIFGEAQVIPWVDFGDTDLFSSLGGAVILGGNGEIGDPESEMLGGYIVYESAEIAYQEYVRKLGEAYENPSSTASAAGTTVWILGTAEMQLGTARIGYVMLLAGLSGPNGRTAMDDVIDHLATVAARVDA